MLSKIGVNLMKNKLAIEIKRKNVFEILQLFKAYSFEALFYCICNK
jgi:sulfur relay (sulfurtransferase) DsrF/TusC family protein